MATRGQQTVIEYHAWNTVTNNWQTGDAANHTLRWTKDGVSAAPANAPSEMDAANSPGGYKITVANTEADCLFGKLTGKSSTAGVVIFGPGIGFEQLPVAAPGANGGLPLSDANGRVDIGRVLGTAQTAGDLAALLNTIASYVDTEVASILADVVDGVSGLPALQALLAAVKAKTDNLPVAPAAVSDIPTAAQNADKLLGRNIAGAADAGDAQEARSVRNALRAMRNKVDTTASPAQIMKEDDATVAWTTALTTAVANPVVTSDPT